MKNLRGTIKIYFIGITSVIIIILCLVKLYGTDELFHTMITFFGGFEMGAASATIASKIYKRW